jgi:hypothetical protein
VGIVVLLISAYLIDVAMNAMPSFVSLVLIIICFAFMAGVMGAWEKTLVGGRRGSADRDGIFT